jgi:NACalpha-BTF3-like transcription factor
MEPISLLLNDDKLTLRGEENCSICFENLIDNYCQLNCSHYFHTQCINKWFEKKNSCPLCRENFASNNDTKNNYPIEPFVLPPAENDHFRMNAVAQTFTIDHSIIYNISNPFSNPIVERTEDGYNRYTYENGTILHMLSNENNNQHFSRQILSYDELIRFELNDDETKYYVFKENSVIEDWKIEKTDIDLVRDQTGCSLEQIIRALINNNMDIVDAIMELTM